MHAGRSEDRSACLCTRMGLESTARWTGCAQDCTGAAACIGRQLLLEEPSEWPADGRRWVENPGGGPHRDTGSQWYVSPEDWPSDKYPPWAHGAGYILTKAGSLPMDRDRLNRTAVLSTQSLPPTLR